MATTVLHPAPTYRSSLYDWVTTTDHLKIEVPLYIINSFIFFFIGGILAMLVRTELAVPGLQFVTDRTYNEMLRCTRH